MDTSAIAAASVDRSLAFTQQSAGTAILKKSMDFQQNEVVELLQSMGLPGLGQNLDISA